MTPDGRRLARPPAGSSAQAAQVCLWPSRARPSKGENLERETGTRSRDPLLGKATSSHERRTQCTLSVRCIDCARDAIHVLASRAISAPVSTALSTNP